MWYLFGLFHLYFYFDMAQAQQQNAIVLPPLLVPFNPVWGNAEAIKLGRQIELVKADLADVTPRKIRQIPEHSQTAVFGGREETGNASFGSVSLVRQGMLF